jgi:hypothetical protein
LKESILRFIRLRTAPVILALAGLLSLAGCATNEPDNLSERPWNAPKGWEHGLPSGLMEGR